MLQIGDKGETVHGDGGAFKGCKVEAGREETDLARHPYGTHAIRAAREMGSENATAEYAGDKIEMIPFAASEEDFIPRSRFPIHRRGTSTKKEENSPKNTTAFEKWIGYTE
ncbi:hypothetical protein ACFFSY_33885 [Paenibacillus aurantiacus]|uniref:Uncharacterized protein n=1 Tax=Paenibacillus aurantiacus TaxID=1936118 RepID=A0ABV5L0E3_9BACL